LFNRDLGAQLGFKGNVVDLAVGVIIGAAFGKVVSSLVSDIIMPPLGLLLGGIDFSQFSWKLEIPGVHKDPVELKYGLFVNNVIDFLIVSCAIFLVIKTMNKLRRSKGEEEVPTQKEYSECKMNIPKLAKKCGYCWHEF